MNKDPKKAQADRKSVSHIKEDSKSKSDNKSEDKKDTAKKESKR
ncbi:hypothetical protein [Solitalea agri]|nr:hypothetical protein [Solitalea agri]